jgi:Protein of unknown function (DUF1091)
MHVEIQHGSGLTPFYNTIINSTINFCKYMNGTDKNPVLKFIKEAIEDKVPKGFIHPCPFVGQIKAYNLSVSLNGVLSQFLKGRYKTVARWFDEKDDNIITFNVGSDLQ